MAKESKQFRIGSTWYPAKDAYARNDIADEFDATQSYAVGDMVIYKGNLYRFTSAHQASAWDATDVTQITIAGQLKTHTHDDRYYTESETDTLLDEHTHDERYYTESEIDTALEEKSNQSDMTGEFSDSVSYSIGDFVLYEGHLYKFTSAHSAGVWDGTDVQQVTIGDELFSLDIKEKNLLTASDDLDDLLTGGIYYGSGSSTPLNIPTGAENSHFAVVVINGKDIQDYAEALQIFYYLAGGDIREWKRRYNGTWGQWNKFYNKSEIDSLFTITNTEIAFNDVAPNAFVSLPSQTITLSGYKAIFFSVVPSHYSEYASWHCGNAVISGNNVVTGNMFTHNNSGTVTLNQRLNIQVLWMKL